MCTASNEEVACHFGWTKDGGGYAVIEKLPCVYSSIIICRYLTTLDILKTPLITDKITPDPPIFTDCSPSPTFALVNDNECDEEEDKKGESEEDDEFMRDDHSLLLPAKKRQLEEKKKDAASLDHGKHEATAPASEESNPDDILGTCA